MTPDIPNRAQILESPYRLHLQGRVWAPQIYADPTWPTPYPLWSAIALPPPLTQILSPSEYEFLLIRKLEYLIEQEMTDWSNQNSYEVAPQQWILELIMHHLGNHPDLINADLQTTQSPRTIAQTLLHLPLFQTNFFPQGEPTFPIAVPPNDPIDPYPILNDRHQSFQEWLIQTQLMLLEGNRY